MDGWREAGWLAAAAMASGSCARAPRLSHGLCVRGGYRARLIPLSVFCVSFLSSSFSRIHSLPCGYPVQSSSIKSTTLRHSDTLRSPCVPFLNSINGIPSPMQLQSGRSIEIKWAFMSRFLGASFLRVRSSVRGYLDLIS